MKINERQQPAVAQQEAEKASPREGRPVQEKTAAKRAPKGDRVELSASMDAELKARQAQQSKRVESIKALVRGGDYQVDSTEVAKKMLRRNS